MRQLLHKRMITLEEKANLEHHENNISTKGKQVRKKVWKKNVNVRKRLNFLDDEVI